MCVCVCVCACVRVCVCVCAWVCCVVNGLFTLNKTPLLRVEIESWSLSGTVGSASGEVEIVKPECSTRWEYRYDFGRPKTREYQIWCETWRL